KIQGKTPMSLAFIKASLICLVLSSIGPWMLAILSANQLNGSDWYDVAIYYYLHFQYNGWLTLGLIGIVLGILEKKRVSYPVKLTRLHFKLYVCSLAPSFLISVLWMSSHPLLYILATVGAWLQWIAVIVWIMILLRMRLVLTVHFRGWARNLFVLA